MRRFISIIVIAIALLGPTYGETPSDVIITLDGVEMSLEEPVYIIEGRTLVPVRYIFEPLGLEVTWDAENFIASGIKEGLDIKMPIGSTEATVNGEVIELDVAARIINSRTYVPIRFVAESTGAEVGWDQETYTVSILSKPGVFDHLESQYILSLIYDDVYDDDGPEMDVLKNQYETIRDNAFDQRSVFLDEKEQAKLDLIELAASFGLILDPNKAMSDLLVEFHMNKTKLTENLSYQMKQDYKPLTLNSGDVYYGTLKDNQVTGYGLYEFVNGSKILGYFDNARRNGYVTEIYDVGYDYTLFNMDKESGLQFTYNQYDDYDMFRVSYHTEGLGQGLSYIMYRSDNTILSERFTQFDQDNIDGLIYYIFENNYQTFYPPSVNNRLLSIYSDGKIYIYPTDKTGVSVPEFDGYGYLEYPDGVAYIGEFIDGSRSGDGMYFAPEDESIETNLMDTLAEDILSEIIVDGLSEEEKIKRIHDYLANHVRYDPNPIGENSYKSASHTAYGAFVDGIAVCDGYAEAFKYLLDKVAIENVLIFGEGNDNGDLEGNVNHAWNLIKVGDQYYHYDLTWNDNDDGISYKYYKKDSAYFLNTHWWVEEDYITYLN